MLVRRCAILLSIELENWGRNRHFLVDQAFVDWRGSGEARLDSEIVDMTNICCKVIHSLCEIDFALGLISATLLSCGYVSKLHYTIPRD